MQKVQGITDFAQVLHRFGQALLAEQKERTKNERRQRPVRNEERYSRPAYLLRKEEMIDAENGGQRSDLSRCETDAGAQRDSTKAQPIRDQAYKRSEIEIAKTANAERFGLNERPIQANASVDGHGRNANGR